jgi:hypothetical protein
MYEVTDVRITRALAMLRGKTVEMPARKHDNFAGLGISSQMRSEKKHSVYFDM